MKGSRALAFACALALQGTLSGAAVLIEDFEDPFADWETGWLGTNSNLSNYYVIFGGVDTSFRGNNPDGLWLDDGDGAYGLDIATIAFLPSFGSTLTSLSLDVAGYTAISLTIFDSFGVPLLSTDVVLTLGARTDPGVYSTYSVLSATGIGGFSFTSSVGQLEGNTSIDNVVVTDGAVSAVPEPGTTAMMAAGLLGLAMAARKRRQN